MSKRGQIYILAAILLAVVIYSLSIVVNVVQQEDVKGDFASLSKNYEVESSKLINSVLQSGGSVTESFANFTFLFTSYSKAKSPGFNIFYALAYENVLQIGNFMSEDIKVYIPCPTTEGACVEDDSLPGCLGNISAHVSFEGLSLEYLYSKGDFKTLRENCVKSMGIGDTGEYCVAISGNMYNLSVDPNVPKMFSLSRLESGEQVLQSIQGTVGQERICEGRSEDNCRYTCGDTCCWLGDKCAEGRCLCAGEDDSCLNIDCCLGLSCENGICEEEHGQGGPD